MSARLHRSQNAAAWGADIDARTAERQRAAEQASDDNTVTVPGPNPQGSHHWLMSVQWSETRRWIRRPVVNGATYGGTTTPMAGQSRADVYEHMREHVYSDLAKTVGVHSPTVVLWSLEPNQLGSPA